MPKGYNKVIENIGKYETIIKEAEDISTYLKEKCNITYSVAEANEKCDLYYKNLEKSINVFVGDLEFFNSKIKEYNEWTVVENKSVISYETGSVATDVFPSVHNGGQRFRC